MRCMTTKMRNFRSDPATDEAIEYLRDEFPDATFADIVRASLTTHAQLRRREALRAEALATRDDPADRAAAQALAAEMEAMNVW